MVGALVLSPILATTQPASAADFSCGDLLVTTDSVDHMTCGTVGATPALVLGTGSHTVTQADPATPTTTTIVIQPGNWAPVTGTVELTLDGVNISSPGAANAAIEVAEPSADVTILLSGSNTLLQDNGVTSTRAALQKSNVDGKLTIANAPGTTGTLTATTTGDGAAIGGQRLTDGSNIFIEGGTITATSKGGAGIGGGSGSGGTTGITISGGDVTARSTYGSGIGGGYSPIRIEGITITGSDYAHPTRVRASGASPQFAGDLVGAFAGGDAFSSAAAPAVGTVATWSDAVAGDAGLWVTAPQASPIDLTGFGQTGSVMMPVERSVISFDPGPHASLTGPALTDFTNVDEDSIANPTVDPKPGYEFFGWLIDDASDPVFSYTITKGTFHNYQFVADVRPIKYTITYDLHGGNWPSGVTAPTSYTIEDTLGLSSKPVPGNSSEYFSHWVLSRDGVAGSEVVINDPSTIVAAGSMGNITLRAVYAQEDKDLTTPTTVTGAGSSAATTSGGAAAAPALAVTGASASLPVTLGAILLLAAGGSVLLRRLRRSA
ncbi:hypothetical protein G7067_04270 [Leucobacter insecticola]|uniref:Gram-positive cocci surface proteins LPxTG domain-containing protein n=1 Tax=Leucobacter insecticola TaxID=2714934 RepID=A0A6G8FHH2_9MICO|nr:InlB B-repeat-containing protein [Leucobacter insecticola]QIM15808.1 hypothetical protein G7067_04270 [Leucobacter insecticola]